MSENRSTDETAVAESTHKTSLTTGETDVTIVFTPERGQRRRVRYEPRSNADGWWRIHAVWTGCTWRIVGREPVIDVVIESEQSQREGHDE